MSKCRSDSPPQGISEVCCLELDRAGSQHEPPAADLYEPAWVLIFNEGQDNEGVYTHSEQGGSDSLLAFENLHDAEHFAQVLQTKGAVAPKNPSLDQRSIQSL